MALKTRDFACGIGVLMLGLGLHVYNAGELLTCVALSLIVILLGGLLLLTAYFAWNAGKQALSWRIHLRRIAYLSREYARR
jgi:hypothetical protein